MKKFLLGLFGFISLGLLNFSISENTCKVQNYISSNILYSGQVTSLTNGFSNVFDYGNNGAGTYCIKFTNLNSTYQFGFANTSSGTPSNLYRLYSDQAGNWICLYGNKQYFNINTYQGYTSSTINYEVFKLSTFFDTSVPCQSDINDLQDLYNGCMSELSGYDLDYRTCVSEYQSCISDYGSCTNSLNYCYYDLGNCRSGVCSGEYLSNLYINSDQYPSQSNIFINIPDYLTFDYSSDGNIVDVDVSYGADADYMQSVIDINTYRPTSSDFTNVFVSGLTLIFPYIIFALFILFMWKLIRRIFK